MNKRTIITIIMAMCLMLTAFVKRGFPGYMFGKTVFAFFDYAEPRVYFFIDYIAIMILFMMTGCLLVYVLNMISNSSSIR